MRNLIIALVAVAAVALLAGPAGAALVDEDFQTPTFANETASPGFSGWSYVGNSVESVNEAGENDFPGDDNFSPDNQGIEIGWTTAKARYVLPHAWSTDDVYNLTVNAAPKVWNIANARWIRPKIRQNDEDDTVLWDPGETAETKLFQDTEGLYSYGDPGPYGESTWQAEAAETLYTFTVDASTFSAGTPGETIYLELGSSGQRGMRYDNVHLTFVPEPAAMALIGIGGIGILLRRRRRA